LLFWDTVYTLSTTPAALHAYLLRVAYERPFHQALGAFLPCYWIYWEVGRELVKRGSPVSIYQRRIDTYASADFGTVVQQVLGLADQVATTETSEDRERVAQHFVMTSQFEYMFWDMGYRQQVWEV
jgi:thiaminase/transcriptional activator TenA